MNDKQYYWFTIKEETKYVCPRDMSRKYSDQERAHYHNVSFGKSNMINGADQTPDGLICRSNVMPSWAWNKLYQDFVDQILQDG